MRPPNANPYLRTKVLTASPEQLRMMLYDGAIKFCRQAIEAIGQKQFDESYASLLRAQKIVMELCTSLDRAPESPDAPEDAGAPDDDLREKLIALYTYIHRRLVDGNMQRDVAPIHEAIQLIDYERQTWRMVMDKLAPAGSPAPEAPEAAPFSREAQRSASPEAPQVPASSPKAPPAPPANRFYQSA